MTNGVSSKVKNIILEIENKDKGLNSSYLKNSNKIRHDHSKEGDIILHSRPNSKHGQNDAYNLVLDKSLEMDVIVDNNNGWNNKEDNSKIDLLTMPKPKHGQNDV